MSARHHVVFTSGILLASLFSSLLTGCGGSQAEDIESAKALEAMGAKIVRDENVPGKPVTSVEFTQVTDAGLKELAGLKRLRSLSLAGTQVTDAGMKELVGLQRLAVLNLTGTKVTDAGLKELTSIKSLHNLTLQDTGVTGAGVAELENALPYCMVER